MYPRLFQCPNCDSTINPIIYSYFSCNEIVECPKCKKVYRINYNVEFVDGMRRDLTSITEVPEDRVV